MRKIFFIFLYSLYIFFTLGLLFHTSAHPQLFHKYTLKYAFLLLLLIISFPVYLWGMYFLGKKSVLKIKGRIVKVTPGHKLLLSLILGFMLLLPTEFYLRQKYTHFETTNYQYTIESFDPFLQFKLTKDYTTHVNSYGFRADEIKKEKPKNTYRIFLLGGSTVLNRGTDFEKTSAQLLEMELQKLYPQKHIEVINAGNDGYTSEHSLIQYLFKIKDFHPDLIIIWQGVNDLYYSCLPQNRTYGIFQSDYSHFYGADGQMVFNHFNPEPLVQVKLLTVDLGLRFLRENWYSDIFNIYKQNNPFPGYYEDRMRPHQYTMNKFPSVHSYQRNIVSLIQALKADHVTVILGNQPSLYDQNISDKAKRTIFFPILYCKNSDGKYPTFISIIKAMKQFNTITEQIAKDNDVDFVDLDAALPKTTAYFTDDVHYTEKGNEKIAQTLYNLILSHGVITE